MTKIFPVYGIGWQRKIYSTKTLEIHSTELDCVNSCLNLERSKCNLFIMKRGKCFLGIIDIINGYISSYFEEANHTSTPETAIVSIGELISLL